MRIWAYSCQNNRAARLRGGITRARSIIKTRAPATIALKPSKEDSFAALPIASQARSGMSPHSNCAGR